MFAVAILYLYKDFLRSKGKRNKNRDIILQSNMRQDMFKAYHSLGTDIKKELDILKNNLQCIILREYVFMEIVVTTHIVPAYLTVKLVNYIFELDSKTYLFNINNYLILISIIEKMFNKGSLVIILVDVLKKLIYQWKTLLLNKVVQNQKILS